jgi:hypothetical protein
MDEVLHSKIGIVDGPDPFRLPFFAVIADDMNAILQKYLGKAVGRLGFRLMPLGQEVPADIAADRDFMSLYARVRPFTMTSPERLYALYQSVQQVVRHNIPGDFVECGVWKGGSCMMMALLLEKLGDTSRRIWLYDTFEGMSEPTEADRQLTGESAETLLQQEDKADQSSVWCWSTIEEVRANVLSTGLAPDRFIFSKGKVEDTIPGTIPEAISLLRLDTDWYESTRHELVHLYPLLASHGILIIDDFGHWEGAKKAVLEYFSGQDPLIHRVDYTGRLMVKP